jgi:miniconductance mechanosensitive channel
MQIMSNDMIRIGDWVEMPQANADGDVVDIALHTVKIQNWDKTISTIPTHLFISESFKNWRGMSLSGGRRIKRSLCIDMNSVRFLTEEEIARFSEWALLRDYLAEKSVELASWNAQPGRNAQINADIRRLTNVGTLRAYIRAYLMAHPNIHQSGYTLLVRQLASTEVGLPIEVYCFSNDQEWGRYESIQADIFDHILAMVPEFGLRIFQSPAGADFDRLGTGGGAEGGGESA